MGPSEWVLRKYPDWRDDFCPKVVVGTCEPAQHCMIQWERETFTLENSEHLIKKEHLQWPQNKTKQKLVWTIREYGRSFWGATVFHVYLVGHRLVQCVTSIELYVCDLYTFPNIFVYKKVKNSEQTVARGSERESVYFLMFTNIKYPWHRIYLS